MAIDYFTNIDNSNLKFRDFKDEPPVFNEDHSFARILKIISVEPLKSLTLQWRLPQSCLFNNKKSSEYIAHVLGHQGKNSLMSYLIKQKLALSVNAHTGGRLNQSLDLLTLFICLTEKGE